jgi:hypothetical protein
VIEIKMVSVCIAFVPVVFLANAIAAGYTRGDDPAQYQGASQMLLAESGDNPWALPQRPQGAGGLPSYITNPKYATKEDVETKLNDGNKQRSNSGTPAQPQQQVQPGYGAAPLGLPAVPQIYAPYYQPGYPVYPGTGMMPGMGMPYMGNPGFGGNPLITPYGNIYGNVVPYQESQPSSGD